MTGKNTHLRPPREKTADERFAKAWGKMSGPERIAMEILADVDCEVTIDDLGWWSIPDSERAKIITAVTNESPFGELYATEYKGGEGRK